MVSKFVVGVIGSGTMGSGIAQVAAMAGHPVVLLDANREALDTARSSIHASLQKFEQKGRLSEPAESVLARITATTEMGKMANAELVIEAIVERLDAKQSLFRELESVVSESCVLATNTSSIPIESIGAALQRPDRLLGLHFFNPAPLMRLVEVIVGLKTRSGQADEMRSLMTAWGKNPVVCASSPGFIVNRVARGFYTEGLAALVEIPLPPHELDGLFVHNGGFKMGPCALTDLIGQDVNAAVTRSLFEQFNYDPRYRPTMIQQRLIDAGLLGQKSAGGGVVENWSASSRKLPIELAAGDRTHNAESGVLTLVPHLRGACKQVDLPDNTIRLGEIKLVAVGQDSSDPSCVLVDWSRNPESRVVGLDFQRTSVDDRQQVVSWLSSCGYEVIDLNMRLGGVMAATLAMLVNEALEAWYQHVADEESIDSSMKLGLNHPIGPLEWSALPGVLDGCEALLNQLQNKAGGERYRPSAGFGRWRSHAGAFR